MDADWRKRLQIILIIGVVLVAARTAYIFYERRQPVPQQPAETYSTNLDDYVTPPKVFPYDLKSAKKELDGKTVWVRAGNAVPYYHYNPASHEASLAHHAGLLPPLEKLQIKDVILQKMPVALKAGQVAVVQKQVLAVVDMPGGKGTFAAPIGTAIGDDFNFTANDVLFFADPHQLYKHWPPDIWGAIDQHQAKVGMNELQAGFALGTSANVTSGGYGNRTIEYTNNGNPVKVAFEKNRAVSVEPEKK
ncbi:MAG: hypothetical protein ACM3SW_07390 [Actinomycetota bacterium]